MNNWALKTVPVNKFGQEVITQASQLLTSISIQDVCDSICKNLDSKVGLKSDLNMFHVSGLTGSGRTTFCKAVIKNLIQNRSLVESEIIYFKIDKHDNLNCVWNCGVQLARVKNLGNLAVLLASQSSTLEAKENAMVSVFDSFKVVCFDNFSISETNHQLYSLLMAIIHKLKTNIICVSKPITSLPKYGTLVEVDGLNSAAIGSDLNWQTTFQYLDTNYKSVGKAIRSNPKAVQMLVNASQILGTLHYRAPANPSPVLDVLNLIWEHIGDYERMALSQLSELRRALPLKDGDSLSRVIRIGLVEYEPPGAHGNLFGQAILSDCVREFVLTKRSDDKMVKTDSKFDVFQCWMVLLSEELVGLIEEARSHSWPFVPEKW